MEDQSLFSYLSSHTFGLEESWVAFPLEKVGVTPSVYLSLIV
jgi:hypothetical protein